jgi:hypothetical protein
MNADYVLHLVQMTISTDDVKVKVVDLAELTVRKAARW